jgi:Ni,Fe-hydrogenase I small subunit
MRAELYVFLGLQSKPSILDDKLRPLSMFSETVHEGCDRGGYYAQAEFAEELGSTTPGCWVAVVTLIALVRRKCKHYL